MKRHPITKQDSIRTALDTQCPDGYNIECHEGSEEFILLSLVVNKGIDSRLEAVTGLQEFKGQYGKRGFRFDTPSMLVVLRRLQEMQDDEADSLRSDILSTLGIEEV
jgi:hypothetical protein